MAIRFVVKLIGLALLLAACSGEPSELDLLQENPMANPTISFAEATTVDAVHLQPGDDGYVFTLGTPARGPNVVVQFDSITPELLDNGRDELREQAEGAGFALELVDDTNRVREPLTGHTGVDAEVWAGTDLKRSFVAIWVYEDSIAADLWGPNSSDPLRPGPPTALDALRTHPLARVWVSHVFEDPARYVEGDPSDGEVAPSEGPSVYTVIRVPDPDHFLRSEEFEFAEAIDELLEQARAAGFEPEQVSDPAQLRSGSFFQTLEADLWTDTTEDGITFNIWSYNESTLIAELEAAPDAEYIAEVLAQRSTAR